VARRRFGTPSRKRRNGKAGPYTAAEAAHTALKVSDRSLAREFVHRIARLLDAGIEYYDACEIAAREETDPTGEPQLSGAVTAGENPMKIAVCYEFRAPLEAISFRGQIWARGRAIFERITPEKWRGLRTTPNGRGLEGETFAEVSLGLSFLVAEEIRALAAKAKDRHGFEDTLGKYFASANGAADREWFRIADAIGDGTAVPEAQRNLLDSKKEIRIDYLLHEPGDDSFETTWVFIPVETMARFAGAER